tara:strand:+ start:44 stop:853 length:810 start_codon:yes stop_codon:yes gene_type:complete
MKDKDMPKKDSNPFIGKSTASNAKPTYKPKAETEDNKPEGSLSSEQFKQKLKELGYKITSAQEKKWFNNKDVFIWKYRTVGKSENIIGQPFHYTSKKELEDGIFKINYDTSKFGKRKFGWQWFRTGIDGGGPIFKKPKSEPKAELKIKEKMYSVSSVLSPAFIKNELINAIIYTYETLTQLSKEDDLSESLGDGVYETIMKWYENKKNPFYKKLNKRDMNILTYIIQMNLTSVKDTQGDELGVGKRVINLLTNALTKLKKNGFKSPISV